MWSSWLISALLCGQLIAAALTDSSGPNLPRIRPRFPQRGGLGKGKGFPGGGFGVLAEALASASKGSGADPKAALAKAPTAPTSPSAATSPKTTDPTLPLGDAPITGTSDDPKPPGNALGGTLSAQGTALSPSKGTPDVPRPQGAALGEALTALGTALVPPPRSIPEGSNPSGNASPPNDPKPPGNPLGDALTALGTALAPPKGIQIQTTEEVVKCREYPDNISPESAKVVTLPQETTVRVTCWTSSTMAGPSGKVQGSSVWLRTDKGCYIPEMNIQADTNFEKRLGTCEPVHHLVGTMQTQYKRQDCYECTNTNCTSKNIGAGYRIDLGCSTIGEATGGNSTWIKHANENCFFPGAIFQPKGWYGSHVGGGYCAPGTGAAGGIGPSIGS